MRICIRDPGFLDPGSGMENFGSGIRNKHPGSATLLARPKGRAELLFGISGEVPPVNMIFCLFSLFLLSMLLHTYI
jgi:hypothetical protein